MGFEFEFLSKEFIKPSSPTPHHLRKHQFSLIDQNQFTVSPPMVLLYEKSNKISNLERSKLLKQSLSKALTIFYPLAGRINNYSYVDCNDEGALFIEAKVNFQLSEILQDRNQYHNYYKQFIPQQPHKGVHQHGSLFQITYFTCGGLAVSIAMPHMLGDAFSIMMFLRSWAAVARGNITHLNIPCFNSASIFPPGDLPVSEITQWVWKENLVTKSFVFDASTLSSLRAKYSANSKKLSRVQALSIFILSRIIATFYEGKEAGNKEFVVLQPVNIRPLIDQPNSFGNLLWPSTAVIDTGKQDEIPMRIKDSITSVNRNSIKKYQSEGVLSPLIETFIDNIKEGRDKYIFSSLSGFPMYEVDFGWGKPELMVTDFVIGNFILMGDSKEGRGIEACICMTEEDMAKFDKDKELLSHLSSTPNGNTNFNSRL